MNEYILPSANLVVLIAIYLKVAGLERRLARLEGVYEEWGRRESVDK